MSKEGLSLFDPLLFKLLFFGPSHWKTGEVGQTFRPDPCSHLQRELAGLDWIILSLNNFNIKKKKKKEKGNLIQNNHSLYVILSQF